MGTTTLRCPSRIHGVINGDGLMETKCHSKRCGAGQGNVVIHQFDPFTGELVRTVRYREPAAMFNATQEVGACP